MSAQYLYQTHIKNRQFRSFPWWRHQMETFSALLAIGPVNSPHKGQWRGAFMFSLICAWINRFVNNREPGDLRRFRPHYDVIVMLGNCPQAWSRQATNHYKNHGWPSSMSSYGVNWGRWVKSVCLTLTYIMIWLYVCKLDRVNWSSIKYWWTWLNIFKT